MLTDCRSWGKTLRLWQDSTGSMTRWDFSWWQGETSHDTFEAQWQGETSHDTFETQLAQWRGETSHDTLWLNWLNDEVRLLMILTLWLNDEVRLLMILCDSTDTMTRWDFSWYFWDSMTRWDFSWYFWGSMTRWDFSWYFWDSTGSMTRWDFSWYFVTQLAQWRGETSHDTNFVTQWRGETSHDTLWLNWHNDEVRLLMILCDSTDTMTRWDFSWYFWDTTGSMTRWDFSWYFWDSIGSMTRWDFSWYFETQLAQWRGETSRDTLRLNWLNRPLRHSICCFVSKNPENARHSRSKWLKPNWAIVRKDFSWYKFATLPCV